MYYTSLNDWKVICNDELSRISHNLLIKGIGSGYYFLFCLIKKKNNLEIFYFQPLFLPFDHTDEHADSGSSRNLKTNLNLS